MPDPSRVRMTGPLTPFEAGFVAELQRHGYKRSSTNRHLQLMAHLSRWMANEGLEPEDLTCAAIERFAAARRAAGYRVHCSTQAFVPLLTYLRELWVWCLRRRLSRCRQARWRSCSTATGVTSPWSAVSTRSDGASLYWARSALSSSRSAAPGGLNSRGWAPPRSARSCSPAAQRITRRGQGHRERPALAARLPAPRGLIERR